MASKISLSEIERLTMGGYNSLFMFYPPICSDFVRNAGIPDPTAKRILGVLKNDNVLKTLHEGSGRRAAVLSFPELLNIAEGHNAF